MYCVSEMAAAPPNLRLLRAVTAGYWVLLVFCAYSLSRHQDAMQHEGLIAVAVPYFFLLIGYEAAVYHVVHVHAAHASKYTFADTWASIVAGIVQQVTVPIGMSLILNALPLELTYWGLHEKYGLRVLPDEGFASFVVAITAFDFLFYWFHRACHQVAFLWAFHQVTSWLFVLWF